MMRSRVPPETPASAEARAQAVVNWHDVTTFEKLLHPDAREGGTLNQQLQSGKVFAVWSPERNLYLFPPWQLDPAGRPLRALPEVLAILRGQHGLSDGDRTSGWEELEWLIAPHARLHGSAPSDMLALEPALVIEAAREDFSPWSSDARW